MLYLHSPNQFQLRLGWLSVIAHIVGDKRLGREQVAERLRQSAHELMEDGDERQDHWLRAAGLRQAPLGRVSQRALPDIVRMSVTYGVYDPEAQALTDMGHVLRSVDRAARPDPFNSPDGGSPFLWDVMRRFIGLRLLLGSDGDVLLALLRNWPQARVLTKAQASVTLCDCIMELAKNSTSDEEREHLVQRARRVQHLERASSEIYPHLEPLRELGYLQHGEHTGEYALTSSGHRLAYHLQRFPSAQELLESGLSRVFIQAGALPLRAAAGPHALRASIQRLPAQLRGASAEAPLEPVTLLAQCWLLETEPGVWIEPLHARKLTAQLARMTRGLIRLKPATSVFDYNITWTDDANLKDETLWHIATPSTAAAPTSPDLSSPSEPEAQRNGSTGVPPPDESRDSGPPAPPPLSLHERLWLQYVARLLSAPTAGTPGATRWGGPSSWVAALRRHTELPKEILNSKRDMEKIPLAPKSGEKRKYVLATSLLHSWLDAVGGLPAQEPLQRCAELWTEHTKVDAQELRGALLRAERTSGRLIDSIQRLVLSFLEETSPSEMWKQWPAVCEAARGLIEDTIERGLWRRQELWSQLLEYLHARQGTDSARRLLDDLIAPRESIEYSFEQEFAVPEPLGRILDTMGGETRIDDNATVELERAPAGGALKPGQVALSASVGLKARTIPQGHARGAEYAREALSRLAFLGTLLGPAHFQVQSGIRPLSQGRLNAAEGRFVPLPELKDESHDVLLIPDTLGIGHSTHVNEVEAVREAMSRLPPLSAIDQGGLVDARTRLARALHWLNLADSAELRPTERLSHGWVAFEHLVTEGRDQKGTAVIELASSAVALCHLRASIGATWREALVGLHTTACLRPGDSAVLEHVRRCLGEGLASWYTSRPATLAPLPEKRELADRAGLEQVLIHRTFLAGLAEVIEPEAPFAAWRLRDVSSLLENATAFSKRLDQLRLESASFLMRVYEVRNQLVHEAHPFGFDDAYRLEHLYERYRVLINPVVAEIMRIAGGHLLGSPLSHAWGLLRARFDELLERNSHKGKSTTDNKSNKGDKSADPVDTEHLLSCLDG